MLEAVEKPETKYRLRVAKLLVTTVFHLVDEDGTIIDEANGQPIVMYPGKFLEMKDLVVKLEEKANSERKEINALLERPIL